MANSYSDVVERRCREEETIVREDEMYIMCRMEICKICKICKTCEREDEFISFPQYCVLSYLNSVRNGKCL